MSEFNDAALDAIGESTSCRSRIFGRLSTYPPPSLSLLESLGQAGDTTGVSAAAVATGSEDVEAGAKMKKFRNKTLRATTQTAKVQSNGLPAVRDSRGGAAMARH